MLSIDIVTLVAEKYGLTAKKQGHEYHSPCPDCGGRDRMIWFNDDKGNGFCRQCLKTFWLTDLDKLDPLEKLEHQQRAREIAEREQKILEHRLQTYQQRAAYRQGWHDAMDYAAREWWKAQGITDDSIDWYGLGARVYPLTKQTGERMELTAYTIPIRDPNDWSAIVNTQYRIENPPQGFGKYRQEAGLPARSFYCKPHTGGDVIIVEGAKKAIVLNQLLDGACQIVGLPGITPGENLIDELAGYKRKYFLPDPDVSHAPIERFAKRLQNLHVVRLPTKPDDAVTKYGMSRADLREWLMQYRN